MRVISSILAIVSLSLMTFSIANGQEILGNVQDIDRLQNSTTLGALGLTDTLSDPLGRLASGAIALTGSIFLGLMVYAGVLWMTAAGNEEQSSKARRIIFYTIIGMALVMSAAAISAFITGNF